MTNEAKRRAIEIPEGFSDHRDKIRVMLVGELLNWLRTAEEAEAALVTLAREPQDSRLRSTFDKAAKDFLQVPTDWIALHAAEKAPDADLPAVIKDTRKAFGQVDFFLMPDSTVPEDQALSRMRGRVRGQAEKVGMGLDKVAEAIQGMIP